MRNNSNLIHRVISGPSLILEGLKLLGHRKIRWLVLIPLLINILLFSSLTAGAAQWLGGWLDNIVNSVPDWLHWLAWIIWLLFLILALAIYAFTFTVIANLIGSPFYGVIAERVILMERGDLSIDSNNSVVAVAWQSFVRQLQLLRYFIPRTLAVGLLTLLITFVPVINLLAPAIAGCWVAWSLSIQYLDYPAEIDQVSFVELVQRAGKNRWQCMGFGFSALGASAIPLLNMLLVPATVVAGTLLWSRTQQPDEGGI
ncbi:MAG: sulfate transporter CysZ [Porticoccaceae bacterium]|nr:sulfate transporter CysZ [Porticoccaceae bacterium]MBT7375982.1 sulfate transporter CysZ [Porticoccaceae bacterium]